MCDSKTEPGSVSDKPFGAFGGGFTEGAAEAQLKSMEEQAQAKQKARAQHDYLMGQNIQFRGEPAQPLGYRGRLPLDLQQIDREIDHLSLKLKRLAMVRGLLFRDTLSPVETLTLIQTLRDLGYSV